MRIFAQNEPLTETELERLEEFLRSCKGGKAMNIEELDGFFAALIAGPEVVLPSEYLPEVCGGEMSDTCEVASLDEATDILALLMRHWNDIAHTLGKDEVYVPLLLEDENGVTPGNDWACGFLRGVDLRHDGWKTLIADEDHAGCMIPVLMLYHEHDEDPALRPKPIRPEQREKIIDYMAAGLLGAYRYFRRHGQSYASARAPEPRRANNPKLGRNDPCPCGSGKKYKRCCGDTTIH
ncbi:MAG: YecA family protein [Acidobacteria bacterium]|nr:MAG: YecA family protein [Acidobacteriota bacterium]